MDFRVEVVVLPVSGVDRAKDVHPAGTGQRAAGAAGGHATCGSFLSFPDPDGNLWLAQEVTTRLPGRVTAADGIPGGAT
jgi:hypothetical protein